MGYYTAHELQVEDAFMFDAIESAIKDISGYDTLFDDSVKWYEDKEQMIAISQSFPNIGISIIGRGEEQGDIWKRSYKFGKLVEEWQLEIIIPETNWESIDRREADGTLEIS